MKYFYEQFSENDLENCSNMSEGSEAEFLLFFFIHKRQLRHKKSALFFLCPMCVMITQPIGPLDACRSVSTFSCNVLKVLCF